MPKKSKIESINADVTNGGLPIISLSNPYRCRISITGTSDLLFHRWNCEAIEEKARASKNSKAKKTDDIETFIWRDARGNIAIPGEYLRMSIIHAARFKQDPRSPRKSAMDLFKAGVISLTGFASLSTKNWDYVDKRRVMIQRSGINRSRPAMKLGWTASFDFEILLPEYIDQDLFHEVVVMSGRLIGVGDFRPTFGRFRVSKFEVVN